MDKCGRYSDCTKETVRLFGEGRKVSQMFNLDLERIGCQSMDEVKKEFQAKRTAYTKARKHENSITLFGKQ